MWTLHVRILKRKSLPGRNDLGDRINNEMLGLSFLQHLNLNIYLLVRAIFPKKIRLGGIKCNFVLIRKNSNCRGSGTTACYFYSPNFTIRNYNNFPPLGLLNGIVMEVDAGIPPEYRKHHENAMQHSHCYRKQPTYREVRFIRYKTGAT